MNKISPSEISHSPPCNSLNKERDREVEEAINYLSSWTATVLSQCNEHMDIFNNRYSSLVTIKEVKAAMVCIMILAFVIHL